MAFGIVQETVTDAAHIITARAELSPLAGKTILFVSFGEPWSIAKDVGAPSFYETLKGYCEAGADVHYITHKKIESGDEAHARAIDAGLPNLKTYRFDLPAIGLGPAFSRIEAKLARLLLFPRGAAAELKRLIDSLKPDLIYAYESAAVLAVQWLRRSCRHSIPVVNRFQGTILGARYHDRLLAVRKLETLLALRAPADAYIMTDDGTLGDRAIRFWNDAVNERNLLFIRNGIDLGMGKIEFDRARTLREFGLEDNAVYLLTVCRLASWKRVDRAIRIVAALRDRYPNLRLLVCGDGPSRRDLTQLAMQMNVLEQVRFLGAQPRRKVGELMHAADIFLSLYDVSNCGNPLFEAQLAGKPLVTLDNGGTATVIADGINGRLVAMDDAENRLPESVAELLNLPEKREALANGARAWASRELRSWDDRLRLEIDWLRALLPALR